MKWDTFFLQNNKQIQITTIKDKNGEIVKTPELILSNLQFIDLRC